MNYFFKINGLWASRIVLILLLGLSGIVRTEAQEIIGDGDIMGCLPHPITATCLQHQYLLLSYKGPSWNSLPLVCKNNLAKWAGYNLNWCNAPLLHMYSLSTGVITTVYIPQAGMKAAVEPKELTGEEVSKLPGLSKFKPFAGGDRMNLRIKDQLLISEHGNGAALRPALCPVNQSCGALGQWTIKSVSPEKKGVFTIAQSGGTRACLSFSSERGLAIRTDAAAAGSCSEWFISPEEMGSDGEIMSYQIRSVSEPDYALVLDATSQQLRMVSLGLESVSETKEGLRKGKFDMHTSWTVAPAGKNSAAKPSPMRPSKLKDMDKK